MASFDTGLGGASGWSFGHTPGLSTWNTTDLNQRTAGASSVPLHLMAASRLPDSDGKSNREQTSSSLGFPLATDPFTDVDPFKNGKSASVVLAEQTLKSLFLKSLFSGFFLEWIRFSESNLKSHKSLFSVLSTDKY